MKKVSYSQLSLYGECPFHWKLRYIDKLSISETTIHLLFGTAMHTTLQLYLTTMYNESINIADSLDLNSILRDELIKEFKNAQKKDGKKPCTRIDLDDFFNDGVLIIEWFKKRRSEYFVKRNWELIGCEVPLNIELEKGIRFVGYMDVVLHHIPTGRYKIIDIKTSTRGWNKYQKKDKNKIAQLLLYKYFLAKHRKLSIDDVSVEYFIVKRKLWERSEFPQKRVQLFVPANGKVSMNRATKALQAFLDNAFDENGEYNNKEVTSPSKHACRWCEFNQTEHCTDGVK